MNSLMKRFKNWTVKCGLASLGALTICLSCASVSADKITITGQVFVLNGGLLTKKEGVVVRARSYPGRSHLLASPATTDQDGNYTLSIDKEDHKAFKLSYAGVAHVHVGYITSLPRAKNITLNKVLLSEATFQALSESQRAAIASSTVALMRSDLSSGQTLGLARDQLSADFSPTLNLYADSLRKKPSRRMVEALAGTPSLVRSLSADVEILNNPDGGFALTSPLFVERYKLAANGQPQRIAASKTPEIVDLKFVAWNNNLLLACDPEKGRLAGYEWGNVIKPARTYPRILRTGEPILALTAEGKTALTAEPGRFLRAFDVESGKTKSTVSTEGQLVSAADFSPRSSAIGWGTIDGRLFISGNRENSREFSKNLPAKYVNSIQFSSDGKWCAVGAGLSGNGYAAVFRRGPDNWSLVWQSQDKSLSAGVSRVRYVGESLIAVTTFDNETRFFEAATGKPHKSRLPQKTNVMLLPSLPDRLLIGGGKEPLKVIPLKDAVD